MKYTKSYQLKKDKQPKHFIYPSYYRYLMDFPCVLSGNKLTENHHVIYRSDGITLDNLVIPISHELHTQIHHGDSLGFYRKYPKDELLTKAVELFSVFCRDNRLFLDLVEDLVENPLNAKDITQDWLFNSWLNDKIKLGERKEVVLC